VGSRCSLGIGVVVVVVGGGRTGWCDWREESLTTRVRKRAKMDGMSYFLVQMPKTRVSSADFACKSVWRLDPPVNARVRSIKRGLGGAYLPSDADLTDFRVLWSILCRDQCCTGGGVYRGFLCDVIKGWLASPPFEPAAVRHKLARFGMAGTL
jgi:hypothetical protein